MRMVKNSFFPVDQNGSSMLDLAITLPLILILISGLIDLGIMLRHKNIATLAVRNGARIAAATSYDDRLTACQSLSESVRCDLTSYVNPSLLQSSAKTTCEFLSTNGLKPADWTVDIQTINSSTQLQEDNLTLQAIQVSVTNQPGKSCFLCLEYFFPSLSMGAEILFSVETNC